MLPPGIEHFSRRIRCRNGNHHHNLAIFYQRRFFGISNDSLGLINVRTLDRFDHTEVELSLSPDMQALGLGKSTGWHLSIKIKARIKYMAIMGKEK
jgi:hypothetical protein